ncbi:hypothetical protein [Natronospora cellulosivora (SeqCode)]
MSEKQNSIKIRSKARKWSLYLLILFLMIFISINSYSLNWEINSIELTEQEEDLLSIFRGKGHFLYNIQVDNSADDVINYDAWIDHYINGEFVEKIYQISGSGFAFEENYQTLFFFFAEENIWRVMAFDSSAWGNENKAEEFSSNNRWTWIRRPGNIKYEAGELAVLAIGVSSNDRLYLDDIDWNQLEQGNVSDELKKNKNLYVYNLRISMENGD